MTPVYLEDFVVCRPPDEWLVDRAETRRGADTQWTAARISFFEKVHSLVGMSAHGTYSPPWLNPAHTIVAPCTTTTENAWKEAEVTFVGTAEQLLATTGVAAADIDIVITACSVFCPTPSLGSLLVHRLGLREDIISYSLGGMGCSSGVIAVQLAQELLQVHPGRRALLVLAEVMTPAYYHGTDTKRLLGNIIFRSGGAAALMTSCPEAARTAHYRLVTTTRSHGASGNPAAYNAVQWGPDEEGYMGLYLSKELPKEAGRVLTQCVRKIAPQIMTWGQYAEFAALVLRQMYKTGSLTSAITTASRSYVPDFTQCIDHFALHAGGYMVVKAIKDSMKLTPHAVMATLASLRDYGNTSVSCSWYAWAYCEAVQNIRRGQRVLQMGVGSGVKGALVVWEAVQDIPVNRHPAWAHLEGKPYHDSDLPRSIMEDHKTQAAFDAASASHAAANNKLSSPDRPRTPVR